MIKRCLIIFGVGLSSVTVAQTVTLNPTVSPALFTPSDQITITYDITGTALANLSNAWIWVWIPGTNVINGKYNVNPATAAQDPAKFTKSVIGGVTKWSITFKPADFFSVDISNAAQMGVLLKANDWSGGQTSDANPHLSFGYRISLISPSDFPLSAQASDVININVTSPVSANFQLFVNDVLADSKSALLTYTYPYTVPSTPDDAVIKISATQVTGGNSSEVSFQYVIKQNSPVAVMPVGIVPGINYDADPTKVTLCFWAPGKSSVYAFGDFSNWDVRTENLMNKDGDYFWKELSGLTAGVEYGFQYWVEGSLKIAEPFADKILDPEDTGIPSSTYPNLKAYPAKAYNSGSANWYKNRVAVFQTNQTPYQWQVTNFSKPKKESLIIYEVLIRDIFESGNRNYQTLIDTIPYFKRLGINAIELMPVMEFNGNTSWGYNPTFMFAPDKYYGTKNKLKEFVDVCHQNGIAIIFDIALNHQDLPNPLVLQDFNFSTGKPNPTNKWFNVDATHPFNVFFDMNHESPYTKTYLDSVTHYWIDQYKIDGYRFDLSKGFTQKNSGNDVGAWSAYDASRVALLKRMADKIWAHTPDAYVMLEHLGVDVEEKELADYRANEGKGMMLWGKMTDQYNQNTMGYASGSEITRVYHGTRNFTMPHLIGYMESHDEERLMYKNLQFGNAGGSYNVKDLGTALKRMEAASVLFYTIPGPKMLWQFGELGFDLSINRCEDGTVNPPGDEGGPGDCRLSIKPPTWHYVDDYSRDKLFEINANLIKLKKAANVFQDGTVTFASDNLVKSITIKNKNYTTTPADSTQMSAVIVANFDITSKNYSLSFPHTGTWYEYFSRSSITISGTNETMSLAPGEHKMFTNVELTNPIVTALPDVHHENLFSVFPNPVNDYIECVVEVDKLSLINMTGTKFNLSRISQFTWDANHVAAGFYVGVAELNGRLKYFKVIKQ